MGSEAQLAAADCPLESFVVAKKKELGCDLELLGRVAVMQCDAAPIQRGDSSAGLSGGAGIVDRDASASTPI